MDLVGRPAVYTRKYSGESARKRKRVEENGLDQASSSSSSSSSLLCDGCFSRTRRPSGLKQVEDHWHLNYCPRDECRAADVDENDESPLYEDCDEEEVQSAIACNAEVTSPLDRGKG